MEWVNFLCSEKQGTFNDLSSVGTNYLQIYNNLSDAQADFNSKVSGGIPIVKNETLVGDTTTGVITDSNPYLIIRLNGNYVTEVTGGRAPSGNTQSIFIAVIDSENQYGNIGWVTLWNPDSSRFYVNVNWSTNPTTLQKQQMYTVITSNPIITYQWSSVPAISGKNGILSLATLKASKINDGEPVSNGSASDFSSLPSSSKISALVAAVMPEDPGNKTSVVVTYYIGSLESGEYTSAKVAAKKNSIPESLEDADVVMDIPAESGKYSVGSLEELTKYYFVIFVADSNGNNATSNPEFIRTGEVPAPFRETVEVLKQIGENEFTSVYEWTGKWGKPDDASTTHFAVEAQEALNITESATETHFTVEHNETNFISEDTETDIVST